MTLEEHNSEDDVQQESHSQRRLPGVPQDLLFLAFFLVFFGLSIDPALIYHGAGLINNIPCFYVGREFLLKSISTPGGPLYYVSAFLTQLFSQTWWGSLVLTIQAAGFCWAVDVILRSLQLQRWRVLRFVAPLLLIALYANYVYPFPTTMAAWIALLAAALYTRISFKKASEQSLWCVGLAVLLYGVAGAGMLLFALLSGLIELLYRKRPGYAALSLGLGLVLPYGLGVHLYQVAPYDAYAELLPMSWKIANGLSPRNAVLLGVLWAMVPSILALAGLGRGLFPSSESTEPQSSGSGFWNLSGVSLGWNVTTLLCVAATAITGYSTRDLNTKLLFQIDYHAHQGHWDRVLCQARGCAYHELICHAVDRALYHQGRLGEDLFAYPQNSQALLLSNSKTMWHKIDTCLELGLLNEAENALMVCMELYGERPLLLERLTWLHQLKGNEGAARVYQNALERVPFYSQTVDTHRDEASLKSIQAIQLETDFVGSIESLPALLKDHPNNPMAYEYFMTQLLLQKKLKPFVQIFKSLHRTHHPDGVPRLYQEALLLYLALSKQQSSQELGIGFSQDLQKDAQFFINELQRCQGDKDKARASLHAAYGQSFFYYFFLTDTPNQS